MPLLKFFLESGLRERLEKLEQELETPTELTRAISYGILQKTKMRFDTETDPWGNVWLPSRRVEEARKKGGNAQTLRDKGHLMASFGLGESDKTFFIGVKSDMAYFAAHQWGIAKRNLARRAMLPITNEGIDLPDEYTTMIRGVIDAWAKKHGFSTTA